MITEEQKRINKMKVDAYLGVPPLWWKHRYQKHCSECYFFSHRGDIACVCGSDDAGDCHRFPPPNPDLDDEGNPMTCESSIVCGYCDWCGEFKPRD